MSEAMSGGAAPRVAVLRSQDRNAPLAHAVQAAGALPVLCPLIANELPGTQQQREALKNQALALAEGQFAWVAFTSVSAVRAMLLMLGEGTRELPVADITKVAAVGQATARALEAAGVRVDLVPASEHSARGLLAEWPLLEDTAFASVLLPSSDLAAPTLRDGLLERGWRPVDVLAYRTVEAPGHPELLLTLPVPGQPEVDVPADAPQLGPEQLASALAAGELEAAILTSPSTARRVVALLGARSSRTGFIAIGPRTAREARALGLRVDAVARSTDPAGLAGALAEIASAPERKQS